MTSSDGCDERDLALFGMLSHEFRTPMNGILGYVQLLRKTSLVGIQKLYVEELVMCSANLLKLINDLLDYQKLKRGAIGLNLECTRMSGVVQEISHATGSIIGTRLQKLKVEIDPSLPAYINTDKSKVVQILINLISNASKASRCKDTVWVSFKKPGAHKLQIKVRDSGAGIADGELVKIFEPFYQSKKGSQSDDGAGLGLAICKKLTVLIAGTISAKNVKNVGGAEFTLEIPLHAADENVVDRHSRIESLRGLEVLVVDDNQANRMQITKLLHEWKMWPVVCASPLEALTLVIGKRHNFRVGLIDICMPQTSGAELARHIKEAAPGIPLIAMSSADSFDASRFVACIYKPPLVERDLLSAISNAVLNTETTNTETASNPSQERAAIMIVEDTMSNLRVLKDLLVLGGYTNVSTCKDCESAWFQLQARQPDFMFLDLKMKSGRSGTWLIQQLRRRFGRTFVANRVVVTSASLTPPKRQDCAKFGVVNFLEKPIMWRDISKILSHPKFALD